jgi:hypothetical protein
MPEAFGPEPARRFVLRGADVAPIEHAKAAHRLARRQRPHHLAVDGGQVVEAQRLSLAGSQRSRQRDDDGVAEPEVRQRVGRVAGRFVDAMVVELELFLDEQDGDGALFAGEGVVGLVDADAGLRGRELRHRHERHQEH